MANLIEFLTAIDGAVTVELEEFAKIIRRKLEQNYIASFKMGNRVQFYVPWRGGTVSGTVFKVNRKTLGVLADDGVNWSVSPRRLTHLTK